MSNWSDVVRVFASKASFIRPRGQLDHKAWMWETTKVTFDHRRRIWQTRKTRWIWKPSSSSTWSIAAPRSCRCAHLDPAEINI